MPPPSVKYPEQTQTEQDLRQTQVDMLRQQRDLVQKNLREQHLLQPMLYQRAGLTPQLDEAGNITGFTRQVDPEMQLREALQTQYLQRNLAALDPSAAVDPGLTADLGGSDTALRAELTRQLGADYASTAAGQQALAMAGQRGDELRFGAKRADLSLMQGLGLGEGEALAREDARFANRLGGLLSQQASGAEQLGSIVQGYNAPLGLMLQQRKNQFQARQANAAAKQAYLKWWADQISGAMGGMGAMGGGGGGGGMMSMMGGMGGMMGGGGNQPILMG